jgi:hypothetical protein
MRSSLIIAVIAVILVMNSSFASVQHVRSQASVPPVKSQASVQPVKQQPPIVDNPCGSGIVAEYNNVNKTIAIRNAEDWSVFKSEASRYTSVEYYSAMETAKWTPSSCTVVWAVYYIVFAAYNSTSFDYVLVSEDPATMVATGLTLQSSDGYFGRTGTGTLSPTPRNV